MTNRANGFFPWPGLAKLADEENMHLRKSNSSPQTVQRLLLLLRACIIVAELKTVLVNTVKQAVRHVSRNAYATSQVQE